MRKMKAGQSKVKLREVEIDADLLTAWKLPVIDEEGDKESRGRVLFIGGSAEMLGACVLAGVAALRAGAGKLQIATPRTVATHVGVSVPEARVLSLKETKRGEADPEGIHLIAEHIKAAQAIIIGPGMGDERAAGRVVKNVVRYVEDATLVIDANALNKLQENSRLLRGLRRTPILTPHLVEMSEMTGETIEALRLDPQTTLRRVAENLHAVVVLKGRKTLIAAHQRETCFANHAGNVGLATSGSGDVLAGIIAGLAARGAKPVEAAVWGVHVHALAGERLARRVGRVGYLARELLAEIPQVMSELEA